MTPAPGWRAHLMNPLGDMVSGAMGSVMDTWMRSVWTACLDVLRAVLQLVDKFSTFGVDVHSPSPGARTGVGGGVSTLGTVWPTMLWISGAIAVVLFFWQITKAAVHGGAGMMHAATGPFAYGIALAVTVGLVGTALELADGVTTGILWAGLNADNFAATWAHIPLSQAQAMDGIKTEVLGIAGIFGLIPVALGYTIEIIWRQAVILVLVATIPLSAAGLLAQATTTWFWKTMRWTGAAIAMKPLLALTIVIGVTQLAGANGIVGLLGAIGILAVALVCPLALFELFSVVDPTTRSGVLTREAFSSVLERAGSGVNGLTSNEQDGKQHGGGHSEDTSRTGAIESANTHRFDANNPTGGDSTTAGQSGGATDGGPGADPGTATARSLGADGDAHAASDAPPPPPASDDGPASGGTGGRQDPPSPEPPPTDPGPHDPGPPPPPNGGGGGGSGPRPTGGGGGGAGAGATEAAETAVIL